MGFLPDLPISSAMPVCGKDLPTIDFAPLGKIVPGQRCRGRFGARQILPVAADFAGETGKFFQLDSIAAKEKARETGLFLRHDGTGKDEER